MTTWKLSVTSFMMILRAPILCEDTYFAKYENSMLVLSTDANVSVHSQSNLARLWEMKYKVAFLINIATLVQFWQDKVIVSWRWAKRVFICTCRGNKLRSNLSMNILQGNMKTASLQFHRDEKEAVKKTSYNLIEN